MWLNGTIDGRSMKLQRVMLPRVTEFKYLGATVQDDGVCGRVMKVRVQAGWNGWKKT